MLTKIAHWLTVLSRIPGKTRKTSMRRGAILRTHLHVKRNAKKSRGCVSTVKKNAPLTLRISVAFVSKAFVEIALNHVQHLLTIVAVPRNAMKSHGFATIV